MQALQYAQVHHHPEVLPEQCQACTLNSSQWLQLAHRALQSELHQRELEGLHSDLQRLEAGAQRRDEAVHQGYEQQERLQRIHASTETNMQQTLRAVSQLRSQLQVCIPASRFQSLAYREAHMERYMLTVCGTGGGLRKHEARSRAGRGESACRQLGPQAARESV